MNASLTASKSIANRFSWLTVPVLTLGLVSVATASPDVGKLAPAFEAVDSNGVPHALANFRGNYVVLEWTNHECPFVRKHYGTGNMQALQNEATAKDVVWLSVVSSAPGRQGYVEGNRANELTAERDAAPSAVLLDPQGEVGRLYAAKTTPHMFIIDPEGKLIYKGGIDDKPSADRADVKGATNYVRVALNEAMNGQAVAQAVTRPYGCTVKY